jgi:hypothetical protein
MRLINEKYLCNLGLVIYFHVPKVRKRLLKKGEYKLCLKN